MIRLFGRRISGLFLIPVTAFYCLFVPRAWFGSKQLYKRLNGSYSFLKGSIFGYKRVYALSQILLDRTFLILKGPTSFNVEFPDTQNIRDAIALDKGLIILSAHLGSWDIASSFWGKFNRPVSVVLYDGEREEIKDVYNRYSKYRKKTHKYIYSNDPLEALIEIKNALERKEIVVMHGDRAKGKSEMSNFLGENAKFPVLPYLMACKTGAPILTAFSIRKGYNRYSTIANKYLCLIGNNEQCIHDGIKHYTRELSSVVKKYSDQWFNFYDFWGDVKFEIE